MYDVNYHVIRLTSQHDNQARLERVNRALPPSEPEDPRVQQLDDIPPYLVPAVDGLIASLDKSVRLRVESIPKRDNDGKPSASWILVLLGAYSQ
jgi:hypothetical protein